MMDDLSGAVASLEDGFCLVTWLGFVWKPVGVDKQLAATC